MDLREKTKAPPIRVQGVNLAYAEMMLGNIGGRNSEMSAVAHYTYNRLVTQDSYTEASNLYHKIRIDEMRHLETFGRLALLLGAEPRLWQSAANGAGCGMEYWSPAYVCYCTDDLESILQSSIGEERDAIEKYEAQTAAIGDPYVRDMLRCVICDEDRHITMLRELLGRL
ncbi:MAG: demethoxyubiquinone hydroxylase family protein [Oscillospiraceae bacterium]|jgi:bacterioferritin|nr:demethoxyubiquinone hydroxylase family protein [Oscillospiraceae bacterium]